MRVARAAGRATPAAGPPRPAPQDLAQGAIEGPELGVRPHRHAHVAAVALSPSARGFDQHAMPAEGARQAGAAEPAPGGAAEHEARVARHDSEAVPAKNGYEPLARHPVAL